MNMYFAQTFKNRNITQILFLGSIVILNFLFIWAVRTNTLKLGQILGQWMWYYYPRDVSYKLWLPYTVFFIFLTYFFLVEKLLDYPNLSRVKELLIICGLVLIIFSMNLSVFCLSMFGLDELPQIIIHSGRTSFFTDAVKIKSAQSFLQDYAKNIKSLTHHSQVHGPGPILLFWFVYQAFARLDVPNSILFNLNRFLNLDLEYLRNLLASSGMPGNNAAILTSLSIGLFFPFTASFAVLPLYYLGKIIYGKTTSVFACGVYAVIPTIFLFTPQLAQLLTFFGALVSWLFFKSIRDTNKKLMTVAALVFAISWLFSLELLVLVPILVGTVVFSTYSPDRIKITRAIGEKIEGQEMQKMLSIFFIVIFLFFVALFLLFKFNIFESYRISMGIHDMLEARRPYSKWAWANFLEYFVYLGIPITLFLLRKLIWQFRKTNGGKIDIFFLSFVITFLALDLSGINRGEVARLWMFLTPFSALFVASEIRESSLLTKLKGFGIFTSLAIMVLQFLYTINLKSILLTMPLRIF